MTVFLLRKRNYHINDTHIVSVTLRIQFPFGRILFGITMRAYVSWRFRSAFDGGLNSFALLGEHTEDKKKSGMTSAAF